MPYWLKYLWWDFVALHLQREIPKAIEAREGSKMEVEGIIFQPRWSARRWRSTT